MRRLVVEVRYWEGCPSHPEALERLRAALERARAEADVRLREVTTEEEARALDFHGSPTILIDGVDVEPPPPGSEPGLTCRIFSAPGGRVGPVPTHETFDRAIEEALADVPQRP